MERSLICLLLIGCGYQPEQETQSVPYPGNILPPSADQSFACTQTDLSYCDTHSEWKIKDYNFSTQKVNSVVRTSCGQQLEFNKMVTKIEKIGNSLRMYFVSGDTVNCDLNR